MKLSKPAMLAAIAYFILSIVVLLPFKVDESSTSVRVPSLPKRIVTLILLVIPMALSIYSINCMVSGKCIVWAWVQSLALGIWVILFVTATFLAGEDVSEFRNKKN